MKTVSNNKSVHSIFGGKCFLFLSLFYSFPSSCFFWEISSLAAAHLFFSLAHGHSPFSLVAQPTTHLTFPGHRLPCTADIGAEPRRTCIDGTAPMHRAPPINSYRSLTCNLRCLPPFPSAPPLSLQLSSSLQPPEQAASVSVASDAARQIGRAHV